MVVRAGGSLTIIAAICDTAAQAVDRSPVFSPPKSCLVDNEGQGDSQCCVKGEGNKVPAGSQLHIAVRMAKIGTLDTSSDDDLTASDRNYGLWLVTHLIWRGLP